MKNNISMVFLAGIFSAGVDTAAAMPFELSPGAYSWTTYDFVGQELTTGQNVNGSFSFVTSGPKSGSASVYTNAVDVYDKYDSVYFDVDRFFVAEAHLNYDDGRFLNYFQQGNCAETIGGELGGGFRRNTPCSSTIAPELWFTLGSDMSFLAGYAGSKIPYDELVSQLLTGPGLHIEGHYGCTGRQLTEGGPADFGSNGNCGGHPNVFGQYSGRLHAVPEPGTLALLGIGVLGLVMSRRRGILSSR